MQDSCISKKKLIEKKNPTCVEVSSLAKSQLLDLAV